MPDLSLLVLACTQNSEASANVSLTDAHRCQQIRQDEITTQAKSDLNTGVSEPERIDTQLQFHSQAPFNSVPNYNQNGQSQVNGGNTQPIKVQMLLPMGGFLFLFGVGGILYIWKRLPNSKRQWQLVLQGNSDISYQDTEEFDRPVILKQPRAWSHAIIWSIVGVTSFAVIWACNATIDESVPVIGKLEPKGSVKEIQAPVGGVVANIHVQEGQRVKKGDVLVSFDRTVGLAKLRSLQQVRASLMRENQFYRSQLQLPTANSTSKQFQTSPEIASLTKNRAVLMQEIQLYRTQLNGGNAIQELNPQLRQRLLNRQLETDSRIATVRLDVEQLTRQLNQVQVQLTNVRGSLATNLEIANNIETLVKEGAFARIPYLERRQAANTSQAEVNRLEQEAERIRLAIVQAQKKLQNQNATIKEELLSKISENEKQIADIDSQLTKVIIENNKNIQQINSQISELTLNLKYQELRAPHDGIVFDLKPRAQGYVYNTSESILKIIPPENLVAQVFITNNDIGFVKAGMPVDVRLDSFPYTEFSDIKGKLIQIGSDVLPPDQIHPNYRFSAEIRLEKQSIQVNGTEVPLQSGMSLSANINVRKRTVMSIFTEKFLGKMESLKYTR